MLVEHHDWEFVDAQVKELEGAISASNNDLVLVDL